jgi:hypothetical protein
MKYSIRINVGFLWFGQIRRILENYTWRNPHFEWKESRGWLDKTFYAKGSIGDIQELHDRFRGWVSEVETIND